MAEKEIELTTEQIQACEQGFEQAVERDYVTRNSGKRDIDENYDDYVGTVEANIFDGDLADKIDKIL